MILKHLTIQVPLSRKATFIFCTLVSTKAYLMRLELEKMSPGRRKPLACLSDTLRRIMSIQKETRKRKMRSSA